MKKLNYHVIISVAIWFGMTTIAYALKSPLENHFTFDFGSYKVTALSDGLVAMPLSAYEGDKNYRQAEKEMIAKHPKRVWHKNNVLISLNAFLIQYQGKNILVDTGSGGKLPPKLDNGFLLRSLKAIGVKASAINAILLTHLHPDHIGGLLTAAGKKTFPNATIYINQRGWQFWHSRKQEKKLPPFYSAWFKLAQRVTQVYKTQIHLFADKKEILFDGIEAVPLPGHTPGHTGYLIKDAAGKTLLIWGDIVHVGLLEFSHPSYTTLFDSNRPLAKKTHRNILNWAAKTHVLIAGMHLNFPGLGYVEKQKNMNKFKFQSMH